MYRSYLLKNAFWAKKGNERDGNLKGEKVFIKHDSEIGGIYAIVDNNDKKKHFSKVKNAGNLIWFLQIIIYSFSMV